MLYLDVSKASQLCLTWTATFCSTHDSGSSSLMTGIITIRRKEAAKERVSVRGEGGDNGALREKGLEVIRSTRTRTNTSRWSEDCSPDGTGTADDGKIDNCEASIVDGAMREWCRMLNAAVAVEDWNVHLTKY